MIFLNKGKKYLSFTIVCVFLYPCVLFSQEQEIRSNNQVVAEPDSLFNRQDPIPGFVESILDYIDLFSVLYPDMMEDFGPNPYLLPPVFDGRVMDDLSIRLPSLWDEGENRFFLLDTMQIQSKGKQFVDQLRRQAFRNLLSRHIKLVKYTKADFPETVEKIVEVKPNPFLSIFKMDYEPENDKVEVADIYKPKSIYWQRSGNSLIQFSQSYISDNWYKGGMGNLNLLSVQNYTANYKKGRTQFNNFIEWKLSFYTNPNDTLRSFRIGEDLIRYYGDFGLRAFNEKWSYSTNLEVKTQLINNFGENSKEIISSFVSPVMLNMGILGMKYQLEKTYKTNKYKKLNLSADISPLSIQYTYVANKDVDPKRFGIEEGKRHLTDFGSTINAKLIVNFNRQVTFSSRFKLFTNYEKTIIESENELNLSLSRYFSTRLYFYPRFDDTSGLKSDPTYGYLQMNELLSFGFNFKW